ncbi:MAG: AtpZ/AtpI family protein [Marinirhabdus sp.]|nr:AtpZ/AtpI family protein [Marinirhabdus sp.]
MPDSSPSGIKRWLILTAIGLEMGAIIYGFVYLGKWLDATYNSGEKLYLIICTLLGVAISMFLVVKQTNRLNK